MRSVIVILLTFFLLGGALLAYLWTQSETVRKPARALATVKRQDRPLTTQSLRGIGGGESVWLKRYDHKTGELSSQFKGKKFTPNKDGTVHVEEPEAEFFSNDGRQRLRIEGVSGNVVMNLPPEEQPGKVQNRMDADAPSRGKLQDVVISMYEPAEETEPILTARMNNAAFDNDTFRIATESYVDGGGKSIEADQVPIVVRGRDYDFDGRGLVIRWNERDRKLQLLEIAHGESLTLKNPSLLSQPSVSRSTQPPAMAEMLADADPRAFVLPVAQSTRKRAVVRKRPIKPPPTSHPKMTRDTSPVVYRATFERDVHIFEGEQQIVSAAQMNIDMLQDEHAKEEPPAAATAPARREHHRPATKEAPVSQPAKGPIVVKWEGKLRVVPLEQAPDPSLVPGEASVQLIGSPVVMTREGTEARCGSVIYNTADARTSLRSSDIVPAVTMVDSRGSKVSTPRLDYLPAAEGDRIALLIGPSRAEIPLQAEEGQSQHLVARWADECKLRLADEGGGKVAIEQAELHGDVKVDHPKLNMTSQQLALSFDPSRQKTATTGPATSPVDNPSSTLRQIAAAGEVKCRLIDPQKEQTIDAQALQIEIDADSSGKAYARRFLADGKVRTAENGRELRAGHVEAELAPTTRPSTAPAATRPANPFTGGDVHVVSLLARDNVTLSTPEGSAASADTLVMETKGGHEEYRLIGKPTATVTDKKTTIVGPLIRLAPADKIAEIDGPGTLDGEQPDNPMQKIDIAWSGKAVVNGNTDLIDVTDSVILKSTEADGTINAATSDKLRARLAPRPTTAAARPSTRPTDSMNFLGNKDIIATVLLGHVEVKSVLAAPDGTLARGLNLFAETVNYDRRTGRMEVPVEGKMLYQDHRAPEKKEAATPEGPTLGSGRGATAFQWKKSLVYDEQQRQVNMTGDVQVVHRPDANGGQPFQLLSQTLIAYLDPDPAAARAPVTGAASKAPRLRLRRVVARDNVHVTSTRLNFDARELTYDPVSQLLTAAGDENNPITVFDNESGSTQSASELEWNTRTDKFKIKHLTGKVRR